jgi:hypothetical protein
MSGGEITNCVSQKEGGAVVVRFLCRFTMNGGEISNNSSKRNGGGVALVNNGIFEMSGGIISGNKTAGNGGGVYLEGNLERVDTDNLRFVKSGGEIRENTAVNGGAVYMGSIPSGRSDINIFTMTGGIISGNTATGKGGAVCTDGSVGGIFAKQGGTIADDNTDSAPPNNLAYYFNFSSLKRTTAAGPDVRLYFDIDKNTHIDPADGYNTTANWN